MAVPADTLIKEEFFTLTKANNLEPERALKLAVLHDAVSVVQEITITPRNYIVIKEATEWFLDELNVDKGWPFTFENICEDFGLNPQRVIESLNIQGRYDATHTGRSA